MYFTKIFMFLFINTFTKMILEERKNLFAVKEYDLLTAEVTSYEK